MCSQAKDALKAWNVKRAIGGELRHAPGGSLRAEFKIGSYHAGNLDCNPLGREEPPCLGSHDRCIDPKNIQVHFSLPFLSPANIFKAGDIVVDPSASVKGVLDGSDLLLVKDFLLRKNRIVQ